MHKSSVWRIFLLVHGMAEKWAGGGWYAQIWITLCIRLKWHEENGSCPDCSNRNRKSQVNSQAQVKWRQCDAHWANHGSFLHEFDSPWHFGSSWLWKNLLEEPVFFPFMPSLIAIFRECQEKVFAASFKYESVQMVILRVQLCLKKLKGRRKRAERSNNRRMPSELLMERKTPSLSPFSCSSCYKP